MQAAEVAACTEPSGPEGLRWVFPAFDFAAEGCAETPVRVGSTNRAIYACPRGATDDLWFNFSEFDSNRAGLDYYSTNAGQSVRIDNGVNRWDFFNGREYKTALLYSDGGWGVTVYSTSFGRRDSAAADLVAGMRPAARLRGTVD